MITTSISALKKECPMLKNLLLLSHDTTETSLNESVVKVNAHEEEGDNTATFRTFVTTDKEGKSTFVVNSRQVQNREIVFEEKIVERLTPTHINDYLLGENGLVACLDAINNDIEDERCKIDITEETLQALLTIFIEKGVTFEEFTIDFSKLYDKIESYKSITKSVNQVTIKEEIEGNIIESYQSVLARHYENLLKSQSESMVKLVQGTSLETEPMLIEDLSTEVSKIIIDSPSFDEDYKENSEIDNILSDLPSGISRNVRSSKERGLLRKYLSQVVAALKTDKESLFKRIETRLAEKVGLDDARELFANKFNLNLEKKQPRRLADTFVEVLSKKNFGVLTKEDVLGVIETTFKEMENGEIRSGELIELISRVVEDFPTREEIRIVLVDFIAKKGYEAIRATNS